MTPSTLTLLACSLVGLLPGPAHDAGTAAVAPQAATETPAGGGVEPPAYVIGTDDRLSIRFWREENLSADVVVRPDGKISLPLLNDVTARGLTPDELRQTLVAVAGRFVEHPNATVIVTEINSRQVFITGEVANPGPYPLTGTMTVLQLIAKAGGLTEFASGNDILIVRHEGGKQVAYPFFYKNIMKGKTLKQNIDLKPDDTVIVP